MNHDEFMLDEALAILERTPASLRALLAGVPERWVRAMAGEGTWSPYDVVAHLIDGERTNWIPRMRHILSGDQRPFAPFDRTAQATASQGQSLDDLLTTFAELRRANLAELVDMKLTHADLRRTGQHPELGEVRLGQLLATWVVHDLDHMAQIIHTMAQVYAEAVGPWRAYLSIVDR